MFITIAVIFIVFATFLLIIINMYSDYAARREQDLRLMVSRAQNVISETEELLLNQSQLPYSRTLVMILHHRIIRALKRRASDPKLQRNSLERIAQEERLLKEIQTGYRNDIAFRPPENDHVAVTQLRMIRRLRNIIKNEIKSGLPLNPAEVQHEDQRLYLLVLKVNISNLIQRVLEVKKLRQTGTCRQLIAKGLDVINKAGLKDGWLKEKSDMLTQLQRGLDAEAAAVKPPADDQSKSQEQKEIDELFGDKKKW